MAEQTTGPGPGGPGPEAGPGPGGPGPEAGQARRSGSKQVQAQAVGSRSRSGPGGPGQ